MSDRPTQNPTPTVQVKEIGLDQQTSVGKTIAGAGAIAVLAAAAIKVSRKPSAETPADLTESPRDYLRAALKRAQEIDLKKRSRQAVDRTVNAVEQAPTLSSPEFEALGKKIGEQMSGAQGGVKSLLEAIKTSGPEIERLIEAEIMPKLKKLGEEAFVLTDQGKSKGSELAHKAKAEIVQTSEKLTESASDLAARAENEFVPAARIQAEELASQARTSVEQFSEEAKESLNEFAVVADGKRKAAAASAREGGRDTRSLLIWTAAAGALVYGALLNEEQQRQVRETATELVHELGGLFNDIAGK